jgi:hypothetical protein
MLSLCPECTRALLSRLRRIGAAFGVVVYFDEDDRSDTYAEQVRTCPGCGASLAGDDLNETIPHAR